VVARLLRELPEAHRADEELLDRARVLDAHYVPTRYPNGHPEGPPFVHYGALQSREAIAHARAILDFVRTALA
jgi:HEPN domain-containing protein